MITKEELAAIIRRLERDKEINGGLSIKEEKYLAVCKELEEAREELVDMAVAYENLMAGGAP